MNKKRNPVKLHAAAAAIGIFALAAIGFCLVLSSQGAVVIGELPDPTKSVDSFFAAHEQGDYALCDSFVTGVSGLGLENEPQDPAAAMLYRALRKSYSYSIDSEQTSINGAKAKVAVEISYFSLEKAAKDTDRFATESQIDIVAEYSDEADVYNEDGSYRPEVYSRICVAVAERIIENKEKYTVKRKIVLELEYSDKWRIVASEQFLDIMCGDVL